MDLIKTFGVFLFTVIVAFLARQLADEFKAWTPRVINRLIKCAAARLPEIHKTRFEEEWSSHVQDVPGEIGKIIVACGFIPAALRMAPPKFEAIAKLNSLVQIGHRVAGIFMLFGLAPLFIFIAVVTRLTTRSPIFVIRPFESKDGQIHQVYNFGAGEDDSFIGRFFRKTSLNTLPNLINVIRGDFRLVWKSRMRLREDKTENGD